jgi:hypothetical protein
MIKSLKSNNKMIESKIDEFIDEGSLFGYKTGDAVDQELLDLVVERSSDINKEGLSRLMVLKIDQVKITLGIDDFNKIEYLMLKVPKYNQDIDLVYKDLSFTNNDLNDILIYLNSLSVEWCFTEVLGKVLRIRAGKIELVYSYEIDEVGLYSVQTVS